MMWSGGKDSSMALYEIRKVGKFAISALLTTVTEGYDRISMHGVRRILLEQQADSLGIPVEKVLISQQATNEEYEARMREKLVVFKQQGVASVVIGDIFLEDLRKYWEEKLAEIGIVGVFSVRKRNTAELARAFIDLGFKDFITCIDSEVFDRKFVWKEFNLFKYR